MDTTTLLLIGAGALLVLALVGLMLRRSWGGSLDRMVPPGGTPVDVRYRNAAEITAAERAELQAILDRGSPIEAIKRVRELTGLGLKEAKDFVDALAAPAPLPGAPAQGGMEEVHALAAAGNKLGAIKRVRELTGLGLKEAKDFVDALAAPAPLPGAPAQGAPTLSAAERAELQAILARGNPIEAIKRVRELTGLGLKEAKEYVDALAAPAPLPGAAPAAPTLSAAERAELQAILARGNPIEAIKRVRELTGLGLKEAKDLVDRLV